MLKAHTFGFNSGSTTNIGQYSFLLSKPDLKKNGINWLSTGCIKQNKVYPVGVHFLGYST